MEGIYAEGHLADDCVDAEAADAEEQVRASSEGSDAKAPSSFSIDVRAPEDELATLRDLLESLLVRRDVENSLLPRCERLGGHAAVGAGFKLLECLDEHGTKARLRFHAQSAGQIIYHSTYSMPAQEIAAAFAHLLVRIPQVSQAVIDGDYGRSAHGFRYTVRDGQVTAQADAAAPAPASEVTVIEAVIAMCERRGIAVTPGFRKKEQATAKYALIRFDDTPAKLLGRDFHTRTCVHDFVLTNVSSLEPEHFEVLDLETREILRPTFDLPAFRAALQTMAVPLQLPLSQQQMADWDVALVPRYFALARIGSIA